VRSASLPRPEVRQTETAEECLVLMRFCFLWAVVLIVLAFAHALALQNSNAESDGRTGFEVLT
jgi:hypothetical protein